MPMRIVEPLGAKMAKFWREAPTWFRWSLLTGVLSTLILLSDAKSAVESLRPWMLVTYGGLEAYAGNLVVNRNLEIAAAEGRLSARLTDFEWDQIIYRSKDVRFQLETLKGQQLMLLIRRDAEPANALVRERLEELQGEIQTLQREYDTLQCQIQERNDASAVERC